MSKDKGTPKLFNFELVKNKLLTLDPTAKIIGIADPSAPYVIDQGEKYKSLVNQGNIVQVGSGEEADYYMIKYAELKPYCCIITNDGFKDYKIKEDLRKRVIPVSIINEEVIFSKKLEEVFYIDID